MNPRGVAARFRASPFETCVALIAATNGAIEVAGHGTTAGVIAMWLYVGLSLGGAFAAAGVLADALDVESAGLALLLGSYLCLVFETLPRITEGVQVAAFVANAAGLTLAIVVRLCVVRKAARARRRAGRARRGG